MGDRICVMKDGHIMQVAAPLDLYNRPANLFVAGFIGSPPMNFFPGTLTRSGETVRFVETGSAGGLQIALNGALAAGARRHDGKAVVLGVRPEEVKLVSPEQAGGHPVTVELSEPMGPETFLHLRSGSLTFMARVDPNCSPPPNSIVRVHFHPDRVHLFDATSEARIGG